MKTKILVIVFGLLMGFMGFVLGSVSNFSAKSVLGSLWQYSLNNNGQTIIYVSGVKVGIGTDDPKAMLDVNGSIKIGDTNATCNSSIRGAIRFHNNLFQVCNGSNWN